MLLRYPEVLHSFVCNNHRQNVFLLSQLQIEAPKLFCSWTFTNLVILSVLFLQLAV